MGSTVFEIQISDMERVFVDTADIILVDSSTVLVESFDTSSDFGVISCFVAISYTSVALRQCSSAHYKDAKARASLGSLASNWPGHHR